MLDYIYRLAVEFGCRHGVSPNLLYLNQEHARHLQQSLKEHGVSHTLSNILQMEMVVSRDYVHPCVAWSQRFDTGNKSRITAAGFAAESTQ